MPSSVTWVSGSPQSFVTSPARLLNQLRPRLAARMEKVLQQAVEDYQQFTATRPSEKSGKAGRIDTEAMYNAVSYRVEQVSGEIMGEFGFLDEKELYYELQTTTGFLNGSTWVAPTYALRDASLLAYQALLKSRV